MVRRLTQRERNAVHERNNALLYFAQYARYYTHLDAHVVWDDVYVMSVCIHNPYRDVELTVYSHEVSEGRLCVGVFDTWSGWDDDARETQLGTEDVEVQIMALL